MRNSKVMFWGIIFVLVASITCRVLAEESPKLTPQTILDKPAKIELSNTPLTEAFCQIETASGLKLDLHQAEAGIDLLPYGEQTQISATLQGITWREALRELLKPLSLDFQTGDDQIFVLATPWLTHQPQRLTREELSALVHLQAAKLTDKENDLFKQLHQTTGKKFVFVLKDRQITEIDDDVTKKILTGNPQPATTILDVYTRQCINDGCWYLRSGGVRDADAPIEIVIVTHRELTALKCQKRISKKYSEVPIQDILRDLARLGGVKIHFEPGCIDMLNDDIKKKSSLVIRAGTIETALETLSGMTGLSYEYGVDSVKISASDNLKAAAQAQAQASRNLNPTLGAIMVDIPGTDIKAQISIRQQYLEEQGVLDQYLQLRQESLAGLIEYLRNYKPAGQPSSATPSSAPAQPSSAGQPAPAAQPAAAK